MDLLRLKALKGRKQRTVAVAATKLVEAATELTKVSETLEAETRRVEQWRPVWVAAQEQKALKELLAVFVYVLHLKRPRTYRWHEGPEYYSLRRKDAVGVVVLAKVNRQGDVLVGRRKKTYVLLNVFTADFDTLCEEVWRCRY